MTGRRVLVDGAYFGTPHDNPYPGLVYKWTSYRNEQNKKLWGYDIHYDDGDEYYMLEKDVMRFLVPLTESSLGMYTTCTNRRYIKCNCRQSHHETFTGVVDEFGMNDDDYEFVDRLQVEEEDGSWKATPKYGINL